MLTCHSKDCGCADRICTMVQFPRWPICWKNRLRGRSCFFRGYDVLDPERVGFVSEGPEAERVGFRYDTSVVGNSNGGHLWGTTLSADDKHAMIEYLKTL